MTFRLSQRSFQKLAGVNEQLQDTVKKAIELTKIDFGVIYGVRTFDEQKKLYDAGRSQTMNSKHLLQDDETGHAVDLMAYQDGDPCWEIQVYDEIADAMKEAAVRTDLKIRWGAAWHIDDLRAWEGTAEDAMNAYVDLRRSQGRRPFIDGPHFEIN
jgi:peptidoglycan L-alanyl-D-glutamate endopeptidase CwlK